jgi:AraC-like DNA-binding protein
MRILIQNFNTRHAVGKTAYHCHEFWQIDYYFRGETRIKVKIDGKNDYLDDTRFVLIPPRGMHQFNVLSPCRINTIKFMPNDNTPYKKLKASVLNIADYKNVFDGIFETSIAENELNMKIREHYLDILLLSFLQQSVSGGNLRKKIRDDRLSESIYYMKRELKNDLNLDKLASKANMSVNHFIRCFKREFGMTPMRYSRKLVVRKAIELLNYSDLSLTEIGDQLGFPDQHCFSRAFHRETGLPPGAYRKLQREPRP